MRGEKQQHPKRPCAVRVASSMPKKIDPCDLNHSFDIRLHDATRKARGRIIPSFVDIVLQVLGGGGFGAEGLGLSVVREGR
jgi:hypothetical protein